MSLTGKIHDIRQEIETWARGYGLDFFETVFELVDVGQLSEIAAYGGFPTRYPHWRFGMEYDQIFKGHDYGLHKIHELVINNDPCYAYLMRSNSLVDQKMVIAHVFGHSDFFKNNAWFQHTNRKMMDEMGNHATRVRRFCEKYGHDQVEAFIDVCLSVENLIDIYHPYQKELKKKSPSPPENIINLPMDKEYMEPFLKGHPESSEGSQEVPKPAPKVKFPSTPVKDIVGFLKEHAPLKDWQQDILNIIYKEATYFLPQAQTKIINEGWASFWHSKILTEKALKDSEVIDFADHHAGTLATRPGQINPYKLGIELFRDIERRWGIKKTFEVRKLYNDITFIDEFMTQEFCEKQKLFVYAYNKRNGTYEIVDRDYRKVKEKLLFSLTNFGQPFITISDGNYQGKGYLALVHDHQGVDLKIPESKETLERLYAIWKKPVYLETRLNGEKRMFIYTGKEHQERAA